MLELLAFLPPLPKYWNSRRNFQLFILHILDMWEMGRSDAQHWSMVQTEDADISRFSLSLCVHLFLSRYHDTLPIETWKTVQVSVCMWVLRIAPRELGVGVSTILAEPFHQWK